MKYGYGPKNPCVVIVGEAYGKEEAKYDCPFMGGAGNELKSWLRQAGINNDEVYYTNVINDRPPYNDFKRFCLSKKQAKELYNDWRTVCEMQADYDWPQTYNWKAVASGAYLHPKYMPCVPQLWKEISDLAPNLVIPLGNTACWALLGQTGISKLRGAVADSLVGIKALPILHPAAILRNYEQRPLSLVDMLKAAEEMKSPEISRPDREIWIDPELSDLEAFDSIIQSASYIGCDIETEQRGQFIKVVGFSADEHTALVVPFYDPRQDGNYWQDAESESTAWAWVCRWLAMQTPKVFQNGAFDITWLWAKHGLTVPQWEDTLLQAHAQQPELPKDLGTLGSIYTNEPAWKVGRSKSTKDAE